MTPPDAPTTDPVVLPSFYAYEQLGLSTFMPFDYTVLALILVGGALILVGALLGPETRDVDFTEPSTAASPPAGPRTPPTGRGGGLRGTR